MCVHDQETFLVARFLAFFALTAHFFSFLIFLLFFGAHKKSHASRLDETTATSTTSASASACWRWPLKPELAMAMAMPSAAAASAAASASAAVAAAATKVCAVFGLAKWLTNWLTDQTRQRRRRRRRHRCSEPKCRRKKESEDAALRCSAHISCAAACRELRWGCQCGCRGLCASVCGWQCECVRRMAMAAWKCRPTSFAIKRKCPIRAVLAIVKNKFVFPVCCIPFCLALSSPSLSNSLAHTLSLRQSGRKFHLYQRIPSPPYPNRAQQSAARKLCVLCGLCSWSLQAARQRRDREKQCEGRTRGAKKGPQTATSEKQLNWKVLWQRELRPKIQLEFFWRHWNPKRTVVQAPMQMWNN